MWPIMNRIQARSDIREIAAAAAVADDRWVRYRICYMIGHREQGDSALAFPTLLSLLDDSDDRVRFEAADNLVRISEQEGHEAVLAVVPDTGKIVLAALSDDRDGVVEGTTISVLSSIPGIPLA